MSKLKWTFYKYKKYFMQENAFQTVIYKRAATLFRQIFTRHFDRVSTNGSLMIQWYEAYMSERRRYWFNRWCLFGSTPLSDLIFQNRVMSLRVKTQQLSFKNMKVSPVKCQPSFLWAIISITTTVFLSTHCGPVTPYDIRHYGLDWFK